MEPAETVFTADIAENLKQHLHGKRFHSPPSEKREAIWAWRGSPRASNGVPYVFLLEAELAGREGALVLWRTAGRILRKPLFQLRLAQAATLEYLPP
eukprot:9474101-Pyramimonas_sp.AAC.1